MTVVPVIEAVPLAVSIHTPTKGVTSISLTNISFLKSFNPHTHEGCDLVRFAWASRSISFNPHTHEGCDKICCCNISITFCFNPHTHEGCDQRVIGFQNRYLVSIHTPTKGVTTEEAFDKDVFHVSIHTPTKGVTYRTSECEHS